VLGGVAADVVTEHFDLGTSFVWRGEGRVGGVPVERIGEMIDCEDVQESGVCWVCEYVDAVGDKGAFEAACNFELL
jgi:hypothetical protein